MVERTKERYMQQRRTSGVSSSVSSMNYYSASVNSAWQRSTLGYKERFVDDFHYNNIRVRQFPCRAVFEKAVCDAFGSSSLATDAHLESTKGYDDEVDNDRVPDTAFTVWESSILLGMYASRNDVWKRLVGTRKLRSSRPIVTLELGAGTGFASLLLSTSEVIWESKCDCQVVMTDLPSTINFTRLNVHANIDKIPRNAQVVTQPLRWGRIEDIKALPQDISRPDIIFGADLLYTCDESVICALAETVILLTGRVAVFAVCKQHRPESITFFLSLVKSCFDIRHVLASAVHDDIMASDEDFGLIELWRKKLR
jgi:hypothetical protein